MPVTQVVLVKLCKLLSASKPACLTIVNKGNICNASIVSQHVESLIASKSMNSCNVHDRNVHSVSSISHHIKPLNIGKSDFCSNISKPVMRKFSNKSVYNLISECQAVNPVLQP